MPPGQIVAALLRPGFAVDKECRGHNRAAGAVDQRLDLLVCLRARLGARYDEPAASKAGNRGERLLRCRAVGDWPSADREFGAHRLPGHIEDVGPRPAQPVRTGRVHQCRDKSASRKASDRVEVLEYSGLNADLKCAAELDKIRHSSSSAAPFLTKMVKNAASCLTVNGVIHIIKTRTSR